MRSFLLVTALLITRAASFSASEGLWRLEPREQHTRCERRRGHGTALMATPAPYNPRDTLLNSVSIVDPVDMARAEKAQALRAWKPELQRKGPVDPDAPVSIKVVGVGGAGGNAVNGMISTTQHLDGVEFVAMNTDEQALSSSLAHTKLSLGRSRTSGLGAGGKPEIGRAAADESRPEIAAALAGADLVFVTAGMGGGTGTGAAAIVADVARDMGILTVSVVTRPFEFEGRQRAAQAEAGIEALRARSDTLLVVANDRLLQIVPQRMTMTDAFLVADDILRQGVIGTSEMIVRPGLINVDFADVAAVVRGSGTALIGVGTGVGKTRAQDAAVGAICSPLLDFPVKEARGVIFNIVGGNDMTLQEVDAAARIVQENVDPEANIIVGALVDPRCGGQVSVTVLATGFPGQNSGSGHLSGSAAEAAAAAGYHREGLRWPLSDDVSAAASDSYRPAMAVKQHRSEVAAAAAAASTRTYVEYAARGIGAGGGNAGNEAGSGSSEPAYINPEPLGKGGAREQRGLIRRLFGRRGG